jgi:hypothetical protein
MPDSNMDTAYSWATDLADLSHLKTTLEINQRTQLILEIEGEFVAIANMILAGLAYLPYLQLRKFTYIIMAIFNIQIVIILN